MRDKGVGQGEDDLRVGHDGRVDEAASLVDDRVAARVPHGAGDPPCAAGYLAGNGLLSALGLAYPAATHAAG